MYDYNEKIKQTTHSLHTNTFTFARQQQQKRQSMPKSIAVNVKVQMTAYAMPPVMKHWILGLVVCIQSLIVIKETTTYSEAPMQAILHNCNKLLIVQQTITISIEYGKYGVNHMLT